MATDLERRIKRLEEKCPAPPCGHSLGILVDPTEEEVNALHAELDKCPRCAKPGGRPRVFIIFHNFREQEEKPSPAKNRHHSSSSKVPLVCMPLAI